MIRVPRWQRPQSVVSYAYEKIISGRRGFEALAVVLLSLATVGMAWCSYQASVWSTRSSNLSVRSTSHERSAALFRIKANQMFTRDIFLYSGYLNAQHAS